MYTNYRFKTAAELVDIEIDFFVLVVAVRGHGVVVDNPDDSLQVHQLKMPSVSLLRLSSWIWSYRSPGTEVGRFHEWAPLLR